MLHRSTEDLIRILLTKPTVELENSEINTPLLTRCVYVTCFDFVACGVKVGIRKIQPMANLCFTRDQQITTAKGIVMGNLNSAQRAPEVDIMSVVWQRYRMNPSNDS